ncbi:MAG: DUF4115 domain-containing protein [Candidatus Omnitrophica bacterium]|nr:DUF4115 domain-containing protein [Candidatus Omnitrophota bacterium]MDE2221839.1 DUF4115 domain-containing protein [Candidatus Omnitrophota bacterium]
MDSNNSVKPSVLKDTRESKGLTLEIVHEATKIPLDALKAIEEGYSSRILSPFYYRGFIKIYSEFLGLDVKEIYRQYGVDQPANQPAATPTSRKPAAGGAQPNLFLEQTQDWIGVLLKPKNLQAAGKVIAFLVLFFLLFKAGGWVAGHLHQKAAAKRVIVHKNARETLPLRATAAPVAARHTMVAAPSRNRKAEVAVRASRNVWLRVKTDGTVVFETVLRKGSLETWTAKDKIEMSGRDLQRLDMEINGKHVGFLGGGGRRISWVVITPEGLTVKK